MRLIRSAGQRRFDFPVRRSLAAWRIILLAAVLGIAVACRTSSPMPAVNLAEAGWSMRQGQAVWRPRRDAPEIAGELLVARHADGRALVQFSKTPFPIVTARVQETPVHWSIEFSPGQRKYAAPGRPPARLIWLHLAACLLDHTPLPKPWQIESPATPTPPGPAAAKADPLGGGRMIHLTNPRTGESLEIILNP